jgi:hypothetical protein
MTQNTLSKIKRITTQIQDLETERKKLQENLSQNLLDLLIKNNALSYDFETLAGGILTVLNTLSKKDKDNPEGLKKQEMQQEIWKKEGRLYLAQKRKIQKPKVDKEKKLETDTA